MLVIGIDPGKAELALSLGSGRVRLKNQPCGLEIWANGLSEGTVVGVEATGRYHRPVVAALCKAGIRTYLLNPMHVSRYIRALRPSVKTDSSDALMIARYLEKEQDMLIPHKMPPKALQELKDLLSYRQTLIEKQVALRQSMSEQTFRLKAQRGLEEAFKETLRELDARIRHLARALPLYKRMISIDGVGPLGAAALTWLFGSHEFRDSDQAVAFVGLDVSVRQSGRYVGKSKLTKRGPAFVRTFLHNGVNSLRNIPELRPLFEHHESKRLSKTAVNNVVARKIIRIAHALATKPEATFKRTNLLPHLK